MAFRLTSYTSRKLAVLFLAVFVPPTVALVWLGLQLLDQDRALRAQRELEIRQETTDSIIRSFEESISQVEQIESDELPAGLVRYTLSSNRLEAEPANRILWLPSLPEQVKADEQSFDQLERLEFQGQAGQALSGYLQLAKSPGPATRARALLRVARVYRRTGRFQQALDTYDELTEIEDVVFLGTPVDLVARRAACALLAEWNREEDLEQRVGPLVKDLFAGKWRLDESTWKLTHRQLQSWMEDPLPVPRPAEYFSNAAVWLWGQWVTRPEELQSAKWLTFDGLTLIPQASSRPLSVTAVSSTALNEWIRVAVEDTEAPGIRLGLVSSSGDLLAGSLPDTSGMTVRRASALTGLPWTVVVNLDESYLLVQEFSYRRQLLVMGLVALVLLLAGGSYFLWRVIHRELEVARLQTDFVSAVSHEFRTPLTSLRHVTELLQEDDELRPERRTAFYEALGRNTERLHRLVESLLDFARMEGKRKPYELRPVALEKLLSEVVSEFKKEFEPRGFSISLDLQRADKLIILADSGALANAIWNLLDNAAKYSRGKGAIRVSLAANSQGAEIAVQDEGIGIPREEQPEIFRRFVRGKQVGKLGIKGTGLGLAMVMHIVEAHGGRIELQSEEGVGSTFRIVLPLPTGADGEIRSPGKPDGLSQHKANILSHSKKEAY